jgi:CheY-like chemotaxis protein
MAEIVLIEDDRDSFEPLRRFLQTAGHTVVTAFSGLQGLDVLARQSVDLVLCGLWLRDMSGLEVLKQLRQTCSAVPFVVVGAAASASARHAFAAMRLGAGDFLEAPMSDARLRQCIESALSSRSRIEAPSGADTLPGTHEAHAAARWARAVAPIVQVPNDPRTLAAWSRIVFVSPGALRNWCRTAGISPRRSLVFARLLRAVWLGEGGTHRLTNLLDIVDQRTVVGLLKLAGLDPDGDFPTDVDTFLRRQTIVRDPDALLEIKRALAQQQASVPDDEARREAVALSEADT